MGVLGLTSYIEKNYKLYLTPTNLRNSRLVIDGNNIFISMYRTLDSVCGRYGAQYHKFAKSVIDYLEKLQACNITPIIVIDGLDTRTKDDLIQHYKDVAIDRRKKKIPCIPPLLLNVVFEIAREMGIHVIQSTGEADDTIMIIAQKYNCPILSSDGDFYFSGCKLLTKSHFTPFRKQRRIGPKQYMLHGHMFNIVKLQRVFNNLNKALLPLAIVLLGHTNGRPYLSRQLMQPFFTRLNAAFDVSTLDPNHNKIERILKWLSHYTRLNQAIVDLLACLDGTNRREVLDIIQTQTQKFAKPSKTVLTFLGIGSEGISKRIKEHKKKFAKFGGSLYGLEIPNILKLGNMAQISKNNNIEAIKTSAEKCNETKKYEQFSEEELYEIIPQRLIEYHTQGVIRGICIEMRMYGVALLHPQCEYTKWDEYASICIPIVSVIFSLMTSSLPEKENNLEVYSHCDTTVIRKQIPVRASSIQLHDIMKAPFVERRAILNRALGLHHQENLKGIPAPWKLYLATVIFWMRNMNPFNKDIAYLRAVIACILRGVVKEKMAKRKLSKVSSVSNGRKCEENLAHSLDAIDKEECTAISSFFNSQLRASLKKHGNNEQTTVIVNTFGQLDVCLKYSIELNGLLGFPYKPMIVHTLVDGVLFHNLFDIFKTEDNVHEFLAKRFQRAPNVLKSFWALEKIILKINNKLG